MKTIKLMVVAALFAIGFSACDDKHVSENSNNTNVNNRSVSIEDLLNDTTLNNHKLTQKIIDKNLLSFDELIILTQIDDKLTSRDLKIIMIYNSPLESELIIKLSSNKLLTDLDYNEIIKNNDILSSEDQTIIQGNRKNVDFDLAVLDYYEWHSNKKVLMPNLELNDFLETTNKIAQMSLFKDTKTEVAKKIINQKLSNLLSIYKNENDKLEFINTQIKFVDSYDENTIVDTRLLRNERKNLFEPYELKIAFNELNDFLQPFQQITNRRVSISNAQMAALGGIECDCEKGDDWCSTGESCKGSLCNGDYGCGWLWLDQCNGMCQVDLNN